MVEVLDVAQEAVVTPISRGHASRLGLRKPIGVDWAKAKYVWAEGLPGFDPTRFERRYLNTWVRYEGGAGNEPYVGQP